MMIVKVLKEIKDGNKIFVIANDTKGRILAGKYTYRGVEKYEVVETVKEGVKHIEKVISDSKHK